MKRHGWNTECVSLQAEGFAEHSTSPLGKWTPSLSDLMAKDWELFREPESFRVGDGVELRIIGYVTEWDAVTGNCIVRSSGINYFVGRNSLKLLNPAGEA